MKRIVIISTILSGLYLINSALFADANDVLTPTLFGAAIGGAAGGGRGAAIGASVGLGAGLIASSARKNKQHRSERKQDEKTETLIQKRRTLERRKDAIKDKISLAEQGELSLSKEKLQDLRQELREIKRDLRDINDRLQ